MKIFISGANGMVGKNLVDCFRDKHPTINLLLPNSKELNLLDYSATLKFLKKEKPDIIVHLAGRVGGIVDNMNRPYEYLYINSMLGLNLINAAFEVGVNKFLNISSSCIYPPLAKQPFEVDKILTGSFENTNEGYAIAKMLAIKACEYINSTNEAMHYKTIIPCNLYGPFDKFDEQKAHMIPAVMKRMHDATLNAKNEIALWGNPNVRREFMYARDLGDFILLVMNQIEKLPQNINVGLNKDFSILEYYQAIAKVVGYKGEIKIDSSKPIGMKSKLVNSDEAFSFGWTPKHTLNEGIKKTFNYYLSKNV
jgi:GDP-L-fucose synthase